MCFSGMRFPIMALGLLISPLFTAPAIAACKLAKMAELPVTMSDMRPLISAKINGDDVRFAADSGAFYSMISAASAAEHNLKLKPVPPRLKVIHGVGGGTEVSVATVKDFTLADIPLHHIDFLV